MACLSGDPFTDTEALQAGAVDEIVDPAGLLDRAIAIGRSLGSRPEGARRGVKRAVYFGGSRSLTAGLRAEQAEFLSTLAARDAQDIMGGYIDKTRADGELPLYQPDGYAQAIRRGRAHTDAG